MCGSWYISNKGWAKQMTRSSKDRNKNGAGKGDAYRRVDKKKYDKEYERIHGKK